MTCEIQYTCNADYSWIYNNIRKTNYTLVKLITLLKRISSVKFITLVITGRRLHP